jgi:hypothetical protein
LQHATGRPHPLIGPSVPVTAAQIDLIDGVALGMLATSFPSKASLLLAPSLASVVAGLVGWPVLAVEPDRDLVYLWDARHHHFIGRLGAIVARENARAPYPLSAEVFKIGETLRAVGTYAPLTASPPSNPRPRAQ